MGRWKEREEGEVRPRAFRRKGKRHFKNGKSGSHKSAVEGSEGGRAYYTSGNV